MLFELPRLTLPPSGSSLHSGGDSLDHSEPKKPRLEEEQSSVQECAWGADLVLAVCSLPCTALIILHYTEPCLLSCSPAKMVLSQSWIWNQVQEQSLQSWDLHVALGVLGFLFPVIPVNQRHLFLCSLLKVCTVEIKGCFHLERCWPKFIPFDCA